MFDHKKLGYREWVGGGLVSFLFPFIEASLSHSIKFIDPAMAGRSTTVLQ